MGPGTDSQNIETDVRTPSYSYGGEKLNSYFTTFIKVNFRCIKGLNVKCDTSKHFLKKFLSLLVFGIFYT